MFIWERTAPWPMAFWVGRWVAATRVTASGAAEPGDRVGVAHRVGRVVGQLGVFIDDDDQRGHVG